MSSAAGFVLDASVALGAFFEDEQDDYSLSVWRSMDLAQPLVPALWHLELANILARALKARRITEVALQECWQRLGAVGIRTVPVAADAAMWTQRAADWGLSAYDACYLDMALRQRAHLLACPRAVAPERQQVADLLDGKAERTGAVDEAQFLDLAGPVVAVVVCPAACDGDQPDALVVPDRLCRHAGLRGRLADVHRTVLRIRIPHR